MNKDTNIVYKNLLASAIGTACAELGTIPICTVKTVYQTNNIAHNTILNTVKNIYTHHGLLGFCKSGIPAMSGQILTSMGKYSTYQYLNDSKWNKHIPNFNTMFSPGGMVSVNSNDVNSNFISPNVFRIINGTVSGVTVSLVSQPFDWMRITLQQNKSIIHEINNKGLTIFYRGYSKTFTKNLISSSFFFPLYDFFKDNIDKDIYAYETISAIAAGATSTVIMQPFDYIKTRHIAGEAWFHGYDPRFYYKGLTLNLLRIVPHFAISMSVLEYVKRII